MCKLNHERLVYEDWLNHQPRSFNTDQRFWDEPETLPYDVLYIIADSYAEYKEGETNV